MKNLIKIFFVSIIFTNLCFARHNGDYLHKVSTEYITPHLNWAKPLSGGKIKSLFITGRQGARDIVELWQRMDIDFDVFTTWWGGQFVVENNYELSIEGTSYEEKKQEILSKLEKNYDVISISCAFDILPSEARYKIFEKVENGAGLIFFSQSKIIDRLYKKVFSSPEKDETIFQDISLSGIPVMRNQNFYKIYKYGKGRILIMNFGGESGYYNGTTLTLFERYSRFWKSHYENNMSLVAKAFLWASGRKFSYFLSPVDFKNDQSFQQNKLPYEMKFELVGEKNKSVNISFRIRDEQNRIFYETEKNIKTLDGKNTFILEIPLLTKGRYFIDFLIYNPKKQIENFGYFTFLVNSDIGNIKIETEKEYYEKDEKIKGKIILENPIISQKDITVKLVDSPYGKIWIQKDYKIKEGEKELNFDIDFGKFPTLYGYIEAEIKDGEKILIKEEKGINFPNREMPIYPNFVWSTAAESAQPEFYFPQLEKAGFDALQANPEISAKFNFKAWPMVTHIFLYTDKNAPPEKRGWTKVSGIKIKDVEDTSFYNPIVQETIKKGIQESIKKLKLPQYAPLFYNLGDENSYYGNGGYSPSENEEFERFLENKYKKIENLNKAWGEKFDSFDEVIHYPVEEMREKKKYAAYCDHVLFLAKEYADIHHFYAKSIKEIDNTAFVGAEGSPSGDAEYIISKLDVWGPYSDKIENELLRSIGEDKLRTIWWGGYVGTHGGRNDFPYPLCNFLLSGVINGNGFFSAGPWNEGFLAIDFSYADYFKNMLPHLRKLKDGIAPLLIKNKLKNYGIAVYYSLPSVIMSKFGKERFVSLSTGASPFIDFCYRNGLNFDFLTENMIKDGKLKNYKIIFLFGASSISEQVKVKLEEFVKNGGVLIADINPGILDGNCATLEKSQISKILGIEIKGEGKFERKDIEINKEIKGKKLNFTAKNIMVFSEGDIFHINDYGKGTSILLNFDLSSVLGGSEISYFDNFMNELLAIAGIKKDIELDASNIYLFRIAIRKNLDFEILGLLVSLLDKGKSIKMNFTSNENYYIYRVDEGFYGYKNFIEEKITNPFLLYSIFKEKQENPELKLENEKVKRGEKILLEFSKLKEGRVYRVRVLFNGDEIYKKVIIPEKKQIEIPIAFNDPEGDYIIEITDVLTGLKTLLKTKVV